MQAHCEQSLSTTLKAVTTVVEQGPHAKTIDLRMTRLETFLKIMQD